MPAAPSGPVRAPAAQQKLDPDRFVHDVEPLLEQQDLGGLIRLLGSRYSCRQICSLLTGPHADARKVAALALALVGNDQAVPLLAEHLRDPDPMVNQMAEHALWSIWFRGGNHKANDRLLQGVDALNRQQLDEALEHFSAAIALCPEFAEAYNQRALVYYLQERPEESLRDCRFAVALMPCHFGAWSAMGHCHAMRGEFQAALSCYRRAASINAHLHCVRELISELESRPGAADEVEEWSESWVPRRSGPGCGNPC